MSPRNTGKRVYRRHLGPYRPSGFGLWSLLYVAAIAVAVLAVLGAMGVL
jgi:hypothetical protein